MTTLRPHRDVPRIENTPCTSQPSCYASLSTTLPYFPVQFSYSVHINYGSHSQLMTLAIQNSSGLFDKSQRGVRGIEGYAEWGGLERSIPPPLPCTSFRCVSIETGKSDQIIPQHGLDINSLAPVPRSDRPHACQCAPRNHVLHCGMPLLSKSL